MATFDANIYSANKAKQLVDSGAYSNTKDALAAFNSALAEAGTTPLNHYNMFGSTEGVSGTGVSPISNGTTLSQSALDAQRNYSAPGVPVTQEQFDADTYARNKAIQLFDSTNNYGNVAAAEETFRILAGDDLYGHYLKYGYDEGVNPGVDVPGLPTLSNESYSNYGDEFVNPDSLAGNRAAGLLASDHPLFEAAEGQAARLSNARGMQNTSVGATIASDSIMDVAAELGMHEAAMYGTAQQAAQQGKIASSLSAQDFSQSSQLSNQDYTQSSWLSDQQANQTSDLSTQQYWQTMGLQDMTNQFQKELTEMGYSHDASMAVASTVTGLTNTLMGNIGSLLNNPDIEMSDSVTEWMSAYMNSAIAGVGSILNLDIEVV